MKNPLFAFFLAALLGFASLSALAQQTETRDLDHFDRVKSSSFFNVILEKGNRESVRIETQNISADKILTTVEEGRLHLHMKRGNYRRAKVNVYVSYRDLREVVSSGSGNLSCNSSLEADVFTLVSSGSGNLKLSRLDTDQLTVRLSGSANVVLGGSADDTEMKISGSGNVEGFDLKTGISKVSISGSGNVNLSVHDTIDAAISGSGNVRYKGQPEHAYVKTSGSGNVRSTH